MVYYSRSSFISSSQKYGEHIEIIYIVYIAIYFFTDTENLNENYMDFAILLPYAMDTICFMAHRSNMIGMICILNKFHDLVSIW